MYSRLIFTKPDYGFTLPRLPLFTKHLILYDVQINASVSSVVICCEHNNLGAAISLQLIPKSYKDRQSILMKSERQGN